MSSMSRRTLAACVVVLGALVSLPALAVDGVLLIDQNRAIAGNVTPGDVAGFPVSITRAGSYRLSGNLTAPAGVNGIEISADGVTLDLNGFSIAGAGAGAISAPAPQSMIHISNGMLTGFNNGIGMISSTQVRVQDVHTTNSGGTSIVVGARAMLLNNSGQGLIQATCPSILRENVTTGFMTIFIPASGENCVRWNNRSLGFTGPVTQ